MTYEWDGRQAKRAFIVKIMTMVAVTLATVGVPIGIVVALLKAS